MDPKLAALLQRRKKQQDDDGDAGFYMKDEPPQRSEVSTPWTGARARLELRSSCGHAFLCDFVGSVSALHLKLLREAPLNSPLGQGPASNRIIDDCKAFGRKCAGSDVGRGHATRC
jgi:hypothetical protein